MSDTKSDTENVPNTDFGVVRARYNGVESNMSRFFAENLKGVTILDEPTHGDDGSPRPNTATGGRPLKPQTTVDEASAAKKATAAQSKEKD